ncbi:hypothetical protein CIL05_02315 [Virgibacillus profundi]|uniref:LemA family protein n=1 Tax=Virgibacillus profundi TaxID=2024555 RepID=A0A2A2IHP1_9BACI|nr:LemA family protein [Virgibacillus profundi]PAV31511.1 hypothetical protein CIL05_02315 [Virgibacillus profundi]PXY55697.1 LemA family protein [Virgibacillus profundi]
MFKIDSFLAFLLTPTGLILAGIVIIIIIFMTIYNRFVALRNRTRQAFRSIDTYLEQRFDALTKLADAVASHNEHERSTYTELAAIRSNYKNMTDDEKVAASNEAEDLKARLNVQVENYPELKADGLYLNMMKTTTDIEEKLSASRRSYNANAYKFNTMLDSFPTNIFGKMMNFKKAEMFRATEEKREDIDLRARLRGM